MSTCSKDLRCTSYSTEVFGSIPQSSLPLSPNAYELSQLTNEISSFFIVLRAASTPGMTSASPPNNTCANTRSQTRSMLSKTCCKLFSKTCYNAALQPVNNSCCQQPLFTAVVHGRQALFNHYCNNHEQACFINYCRLLLQLFQQLFFVNIEQLLIKQYSSTLSFQQVLLNLDNNIVQRTTLHQPDQ